MTAYYNEIDPFAAQWLRELIAAGQIAPGEVDERSIEDVRPDELAGFTQCHFFAGIGVWSHALRRAGWPDDRPVWTGSCPCQPFSAAGKGDGFADERHLWPAFFHLIEQCEPSDILGEQVASGGAGLWFDLVQADLEAMGYAFGLVPMPAAGFGGAHIRDRAFWVANADSTRLEGRIGVRERSDQLFAGAGSVAGGMAHPMRSRRETRRTITGNGSASGLRAISGLADTDSQDSGRRGICGPIEGFDTRIGAARERPAGLRQDHHTDAPMLGRDAADWLFCRDGKWRPVGPGTFPLAHEAPARVGRLRGYGNGLDAQAATVFIEAVMAA